MAIQPRGSSVIHWLFAAHPAEVCLHAWSRDEHIQAHSHYLMRTLLQLACLLLALCSCEAAEWGGEAGSLALRPHGEAVHAERHTLIKVRSQ